MKKRHIEVESDSGPVAEPIEPDPSAETLVPAEGDTISPEQLAELKERASKADEHWDRLLRTTADFDNFKKRATREKQDAIKFANESLLQKLIPVLDNFDMALSAAQNAQADGSQSLQTGINMIYQQLKGLLAEAGVEEVDAAGKPFDPNFHEAVSQKETTEAPEGHVVQQLRKGYKLRERLLRPASVVVAKQPAA
jgi:molecular chaperone GrpE